MSEQLNYLPKPKEPPPRWSWCAVIGFPLCLPGPFLGIAIAIHVNDSTLGFILMFGPFVIGMILSLLGCIYTSDPRQPLRGRGLALAGAMIGGLWIVFFILFLACLATRL